MCNLGWVSWQESPRGRLAPSSISGVNKKPLPRCDLADVAIPFPSAWHEESFLISGEPRCCLRDAIPWERSLCSFGFPPEEGQMDPAAAMATREPNKQHTLDSALEMLQGWDFPQAPRALLEREGWSCQSSPEGLFHSRSRGFLSNPLQSLSSCCAGCPRCFLPVSQDVKPRLAHKGSSSPPKVRSCPRVVSQVGWESCMEKGRNAVGGHWVIQMHPKAALPSPWSSLGRAC